MYNYFALKFPINFSPIARMHSLTRHRSLTRHVYYNTLINGPLSSHNGCTLHCTARDAACVIRVHALIASKSMISQRASVKTNDKYAWIVSLSGIIPDLNTSCKYLHKRPSYIQVSNTRRPCVGSQKASTKLAGNNPVRPVRCCIPLYHPSSRFFCTYIMSPTRSSSSNSLLGGYGTIQRNLYPALKLNTVITE